MNYRLTPEEWADVEKEIDQSKIGFGHEGTVYNPKTGKLEWESRYLCPLDDPRCN